MNKEDVVLICNGILLGHRKEENNAICSSMGAIRDYHTKGSKSEKEGQIPYDITYMCNLKYGANEPKKRNRLLVIENNLILAKGE